jgi:hypothetical protein
MKVAEVADPGGDREARSASMFRRKGEKRQNHGDQSSRPAAVFPQMHGKSVGIHLAVRVVARIFRADLTKGRRESWF